MKKFQTLQDAPAIPDFAFTLAHELRNPLTNINLAIEMLSQGVQDDDLRGYLDIIRRSSARMGAMLVDFINYAKVNESEGADHSLHNILDEVVMLANDRISLKKVKVTREYDKKDCTMNVNREKMKIALTNIVGNAIDAMGSQLGELKLVTKSIGATHQIRIEDNGCGISDKNMKNLFKRGFSDKAGGIGIGLSSTMTILKSSNVDVRVQSRQGFGTSFALTFNKHL